ncbi:hypothetical protein FIA58_000165 [Flavobacterium jejuense]|uniref:Baseplate structural protein Gp10 C-terminal domain-containing protein n=1 Tax=Flavobacterium jejuense TaxID=1544455 RepID=A0ABX0ILG7_9FLAO|nr:hypothetical protein [Flavobacterium jejuense]NHN24076.1 hypothetical protein [Flavobacterium jejuense]
MEIDKKNRTELKHYFKANDKPTEKQFADFIEAGINQVEDGIVKLQGNPLAIEAQGEDVGTQEVLGLYRSFSEDTPDWTFNLNPRVDSENPRSNQPGLNFKDSVGKSRLFIKSGTGNVGIGTIEPSAKLTIKGNNDASLLAVVDATNEHKTILEVTQQNGVSIKGSLHVDGNFRANNISSNIDLDSDKASNDAIATQKAVKTYIDTRLPKGLISMWSGKDIPVGWALCDGTNGTPNLSGRFIVGFDKNTGDYNVTGKTGGANQVLLTTGQLPAHSHAGTTSNSGNHAHSFTGATKKGDGTGTGSSNAYYGALTRTTAAAGIHSHSFETNPTGGNQPHENRPPYYVLAYIIKL